jgi:hypothetical protein
MFVDKQAEFSNSQAVTAAAISTNQYDRTLGRNPLVDLGAGAARLFLVVQIDTAFSGGAATGLTITLESDVASTLASAPVVHFNSGVIPTASLVPGGLLLIPMPSGDYKQFTGLRYTPAGGSYAAGAISAFLTTVPQTWRTYANARS